MTKSLFQTILLVLFGAALVVAVLIFAGVLPGFRAEKVGQAGNLVVWSSFPDYFGGVMSETEKGHEQEFSVNYENKGNDLESSLINALASGKGPDVVIAPQELLLKHRDKFVSIPFTSVPLRSYQDTFIDGANLFIKKDGLIAIPLAVDPLILYYNKDLYNNANIIKAPSNWEEFVKIQPILTKVGDNNRLTQSAFALGTFGNNNNAKDILSLFILQAGGSPIVSTDDQLLVTLDSNFGFTINPTEAALSFFLQFSDPNKTTYCWNRSLPEARDSFLGETLANYFGFASEAPYIREKNPHLNFNLNLVPQMSGKNRLTFGRLYGVGVLKSSRKISAAWPMVFALTGKEFSQKSAEVVGFVSARRDSLTPDPAKPDQKVFFDSALISRSWFDLSADETKNIFQTMSDNVATSRLPLNEAVKKAAQELAQLANKP